jgi:histidinol-phosphatase (PHP family)
MFICEKAELMGVRALAFCDHCEIDTYYKEHYDKRVLQSYFEISKAQSAFRGKVLVLKGIELAQGHYDKQLSSDILKRFDYDVVIGSVHALRKTTDFCHLEGYTAENIKEYTEKYLKEVYNTVKWGEFDILAHLTYPFRYFYSKAGVEVKLSDYPEQVDAILSLLAEKEKALEINTGGLRLPVNKLSPEIDTVKRFKELGGKYVTFGSDAHYASDLCAGMDTAYDTMKQAGFEEFTIFQKRTPITVPIE